MPRDSIFTIENRGDADLLLTNTDYQSQLQNTSFSVQNPPVGSRIVPQTLISVRVRFGPFKEGLQEDTIAITSNDNLTKTPNVILRGTGVSPKVASLGFGFGSLRVGLQSVTHLILIANHGSDSTRIDSVVVLPNSDRTEFGVVLDSFPPHVLRPLHIGYEGSDSLYGFQARFTPTRLGPAKLIVAIYTPESVIYDTLTGEGVEPLVTVDPTVIDFGTIPVKRIGDPNPTPRQFDLPFTVRNEGTYVAELLRIIYSDSTHFLVRLDKPTVDLNEPLAPNAMIPGTATFRVLEEGDFVDTITLTNDTRYALYGPARAGYVPRIVLKAKVRTGPIDSAFTVFSDTITTCDTIERTLVIHNPYPVEVHIDSLRLADRAEDTLGFTVGSFGFPINIAPDSTFGIPLFYAFPDELLNGSQLLTVILYQRQGGGQPPIERRVTASLERKRRTLTLHAILPNWISSASDIDPMRMPITLEGPRANVGELDSFILSLKFSNDLFMPVDLDVRNTLLSPPRPGGYVHTNWDQTNRTYTITAVGVPVSDPRRLSEKLLMTVVMRAFLTTDSQVTVTPTFAFLKHPCAYNLEPFALSIPYANECGEPLIREFMRTGATPAIDVIDVGPNPVRQGNPIAIDLRLAKSAVVWVRITDARGAVIDEFSQPLGVGNSRLVVPASALPRSGACFVSLGLPGPDGVTRMTGKVLKFDIVE